MSIGVGRWHGWLLVAGLAGWVAPAQAQSEQFVVEHVRSLSLKAGIVPLFSRGYHLSVEKLLGTAQRHALVFTPQWYRGSVSGFTSEPSPGGHDRVSGYGLEAQHRIYLSERIRPQEGFYIGYGPHYQHFQLKFQGSSWEPELHDDGLSYYEFRLRDQTATINRYGFASAVGAQFMLPDTPVLLDAFFGMGWRWAKSRATLPGTYYENGPNDYGHQGHFLQLGLRLGVAF